MTERPSQRWTEGVEDLGSGIWRIPLPLPDDALRAVNVYALADPQGTGLSMIDGGWALAESEELLTRSLAELGFGLGDIERFLVTHMHRDHLSQALAVRNKFGGRVSLGAGEQININALEQFRAGRSRPLPDLLARCGATELAAELHARFDVAMAVERDSVSYPDDWIADAQQLSVGARTLTALATPGHTRGHVVFADHAAGILFAGDHVLPHITPSIGLEPARVPYPLRDYLASLTLMLSLPDAMLLPAHGPVQSSVHDRVHELLAHHERRLDATEQAVLAGASTGYEVSQVLRWTRREHRLSELDQFNATLAIAETKSHLDVLVLQGRLRMAENQGEIEHYEVS